MLEKVIYILAEIKYSEYNINGNCILAANISDSNCLLIAHSSPQLIACIFTQLTTSLLAFAKQGSILFPASLDGTVLAYKFRTFTTPSPM
jgi:hypothetical protein